MAEERSAAGRLTPDRHVITGSAWLVASTAVVAGGSLLYWLVASHRLSDRAVGVGSTLFASVFFLNFVTSLGLPTAVTRFGMSGSQGAAVTRWATMWTTVGSLAGAVPFALLAPRTVVGPIGGRTLAAIELFAVVTSVSISVVVDARLVALRRWSTVFWRTMVITGLRLALVPLVPAGDNGHLLFLVSALPFGLTGLALLPTVLGGAAALTSRADIRRFAAVSWASQLAAQAPLFVTPIIVLFFARADLRGQFYIAWGLASVVLVGVQAIGQALLAEGSKTEHDFSRHVLTAASAGLAASALAAGAIAVAARPISDLFGLTSPGLIARYLRRLVPGAVPWAVAVIALAASRVRADERRTLLVGGSYAVVTIAGTLIGGVLGRAPGAVTGWLYGGLISLLVTTPIVAEEVGNDRPPTRLSELRRGGESRG